MEEDEAETIAAIDIRGTNDGTDDPDANKDGGDGDGERRPLSKLIEEVFFGTFAFFVRYLDNFFWRTCNVENIESTYCGRGVFVIVIVIITLPLGAY